MPSLPTRARGMLPIEIDFELDFEFGAQASLSLDMDSLTSMTALMNSSGELHITQSHIKRRQEHRILASDGTDKLFLHTPMGLCLLCRLHILTCTCSQRDRHWTDAQQDPGLS